MDTSISFKFIVTTLVIEFFTANQTSISGFDNKNIPLHVEPIAFPLVYQFFSSKHKKGIAFHLCNILAELCHSVDVCPTGRA